MIDWLTFVPRAVIQGVPLMYGSTGEILTEKSGNLNLGTPGIMYVGAISGVIGAFLYEQNVAVLNPVLAVLIPLLCSMIGSLLRGRGLNQLSGPVGIYEATETYAALGFQSFLFLVAQISLNIGIFNLLPLPVLDGGQVVITLCEAIAHRPLNEKVKTGIMAVCWVLLISLMLYATWHDISRIFGGR